MKKRIMALAITTVISNQVLAQSCLNNGAKTSNTFTNNNDGTVTDNQTGLMWKVCSEGRTWINNNCSDNPNSYYWNDALTLPETVNTSGGFAGYTNWRLPNIKEIASIIEASCRNPAVNAQVFKDMTNYDGNFNRNMVSSTPNSTSGVLGFDITSPSILSQTRSSPGIVHLVRDTQ